ncbi:hypothetical protein HELRODRAFT_64745 [Helobdella robusta]|uniref:EF-hand domain-containing protein n=1 Tax=Helobdella robusta TaxID=6412 RepID=T1FXY4_HELRO|nr:hypothetical protein HELRODRAFT_64745 [Helobdella robusta]ESO06712.1 hypothetical protein HELRODRAFT_64745 [Helobdella robusta]
MEKERIERLFKRLDIDQDGRIGLNDFTKALSQLDIPTTKEQRENFFSKYDENKDGVINLEEFISYIKEHEKGLKLSFDSLDHNKDGYIDADEVINTLKKIGVQISRAEAIKMIKRMDKNNSLTINWDEWRDYLFMSPSIDVTEICKSWRHSLSMDTGEPAAVPDDYTEAELQSGAWWRHLVAGGIAGAVSRTCTAPFDRLKLTLMVYASQKNPIQIIGGFRYMIKEGGITSLWRGNGINVVKIVPETAVKFMAYEQVKKLMVLNNNGLELGIVERFLAGSAAGAISQTVIYPMEVLKTRLSLRKTGQFDGVLDCARKIYARDGYHCFFKGYLTNLLGIIPYAGIDLAIYEQLKHWYIEKYPDKREPGSLVLLACGTISSSCGAVASYPLALIRAKQQMNVSVHQVELSLAGHLRYILANEGPRGLYRGLAPNFLKVAPAVSISYVVYEHARKLLGIEMS